MIDDADPTADVEHARRADAAVADHREQHRGRVVGTVPSIALEILFGALLDRRSRSHRRSRTRPRSAPEDRLELERRGRLELVVAAGLRRLVRAPALERRRVAEAAALEVVVGDLDDALRAQRLPGQVLAAVPARRRARQTLAGGLGVTPASPLGPFLPGVSLDGVLAGAEPAPPRARRVGPMRTTT